jgi:hypothetical protein
MPLLAAPGVFASSPDVGSIVALLLGRAQPAAHGHATRVLHHRVLVHL